MPTKTKASRCVRGRSARPLIVLLDKADRCALERVQANLKLSLSDTVRTLIRQRDSRLDKVNRDVELAATG
jgi:AAA+ superfamily predicted ATPase